MMRRLKKIQFSIILAVSVSLLGLPAYFHYSNLAGADLGSADLSFENPDQDNPFTDHLNVLKISESNDLCGVLLLRNDILQQLPLITFERSSLDENTLSLRC